MNLIALIDYYATNKNLQTNDIKMLMIKHYLKKIEYTIIVVYVQIVCRSVCIRIEGNSAKCLH